MRVPATTSKDIYHGMLSPPPGRSDSGENVRTDGIGERQSRCTTPIRGPASGEHNDC